MFSSTLIAFVFGAAAALAGPLDLTYPRICGSHPSNTKLVAAERKFEAQMVAPGASPMGGEPTSPKLNVYWHVVSKDDTLEGGNVPESQITEQLEVLNKAYVSTGISWNLVNVSRTINEEWFNEASPYSPLQADMKSALRVGGPADFNVYTVGFKTGQAEGLLGYATFPSDVEAELSDDGVVFLFSSVPGGATENFNLGHTLTHEAGHWVGLYHTFQGGCAEPGDRVADTVPEASPASGCPVGRNTCKQAEGVDPIHNFMDYSFDSCLNEFTPGQVERLQAQMRTFRGVQFGETTEEGTAEA
ncbi:hypothetical protein EYR40_005125 [Pleurotus pulmonarius]|nr:hypothetical protein EYR40_005125 [Pleurotus pulmonarius]